MTFVAFADDETRGDVERGEQRSGAVANVIVGAPLGHTRHHREHRLLAVERLDLAFLIHAQDERTVWRRQVEPNDVADLVDELRVGGQLEGLGPVRLEGERAPDATDGGMRQARYPSPSNGSTSASRRAAFG